MFKNEVAHTTSCREAGSVMGGQLRCRVCLLAPWCKGERAGCLGTPPRTSSTSSAHPGVLRPRTGAQGTPAGSRRGAEGLPGRDALHVAEGRPPRSGHGGRPRRKGATQFPPGRAGLCPAVLWVWTWSHQRPFPCGRGREGSAPASGRDREASVPRRGRAGSTWVVCLGAQSWCSLLQCWDSGLRCTSE